MMFITNLTNSFLCPYQVALDLSAFFNLTNEAFIAQAFKPLCALDSTNDWVNLESLGQPTAVRSKQLIDWLLSSVDNKPSCLDCKVFLDKQPLSSDNLYCLLHLASRLSLTITFLVHPDNQSSLIKATACLLEHAHTSLYFEHDFLHKNLYVAALNDAEKRSFACLKQVGFSDILSHPNITIGYAWMCLKAGVPEHACYQLNQALTRASTPYFKAHLFLHLLMMRFFSHQYDTVAHMAFPDLNPLTLDEKTTLYFLAAYSATLSRHLTKASDFFAQCQINQDTAITDESSLYRLNLYALFSVLQGHTDVAFQLEFKIKDYIATHHIQTTGLRYVNFINIARLYKKTKEYTQSLHYYQQAYQEIGHGGFSTSDHIYYAMNLGSLFEASKNIEAALNYWLKAAMHWLACDNPYALSWRPRLILCQETIQDIEKPLCLKKVSHFFSQKIKALYRQCGYKPVPDTTKSYYFVEDDAHITKKNCYIRQNMVIYTADSALPLTSYHHLPESQALAGLVRFYLDMSFTFAQTDNTLIVDTYLNQQEITQITTAQKHAVSMQCAQVWFNELQPILCEQPIELALSPTVMAMQHTDAGLQVTFNRSFLNHTFSNADEIATLVQLDQSNIALTASHLAILPTLLQKRVVRINLTTS